MGCCAMRGLMVDYYVCYGDDIVDLLCALFGELSLVPTASLLRGDLTVGGGERFSQPERHQYTFSCTPYYTGCRNCRSAALLPTCCIWDIVCSWHSSTLYSQACPSLALRSNNREYRVFCNVFLYEEDLWEYQDWLVWVGKVSGFGIEGRQY